MEANFADSVMIIRGKDQGESAWHCILVPFENLARLKAQPAGETIDITQFGLVIEYRNHRGTIVKMSGWGTDPPEMIQAWIDKHYGRESINLSINLVFEHDDIRLCTMQRAIPQQLLGVRFSYSNRKERFHYIKLAEDLQLNLACRAGIKNYDRVIFLNGINIENETFDQFMSRFESDRHLPVQMLVCSPATYAHYKANNKLIHIDLLTVQRLTPVYATTTSDSNTDTPAVSAATDSFCSVQWEKRGVISTVSQSAIYKSPQFTRVSDICFVEKEGDYEKGKILCIGSYSDCEKLKVVSIVQTKATNTNSGFGHVKAASAETTEGVSSTLEQLPNELFWCLFTYLNIDHLYSAFWGLNARINSLFQSYENLCLTFGNKTDQLSMKSYVPFITRLIIDTPKDCNLTQFANLRTLVLCDGSSKHLEQIQPHIVPSLSHLSFLLGSEFTPSSQLVNNVFSNQFPSLRHASLGRIHNLADFKWSTSPSLCFVSIRSNEPLIVSCILASCPHLDHLQLHVFNKIHIGAVSSPPSNHPLRRMTLWSDSVELTSTDIDILLANTPNVQDLYLQTVYEMPFVDLANNLVSQLNYLSRFDCHIKETMAKTSRTGELTSIHELHPCFSRIECRDENENFRIFATK